MKIIVAPAAFFVSIIFWSVPVHSQCMLYEIPFEQKVRASSAIIEGKVVEKHSYIDPVSGMVYTRNKIRINAWLKNHSSARETDIITIGGVYGGRATVSYPSVQLSLDEEYLFFLDRKSSISGDKKQLLERPSATPTTIYADMQGALKNEGNNYAELFSKLPMTETELFSRITGITKSNVLSPAGTEFKARKVIRSNATAGARVLSVDNISPSSVNGGTILPGDFITITGSGFGAAPATVSFRSADNGGASWVSSGVASDIVSWSDNSITVKVPSSAGSGLVRVNSPVPMTSATPLTIGYTHIEINHDFAGFSEFTRQRYLLRNLNGLGGYTFQLNTAFSTNTAASNAFNRAVKTWECSVGVNFRTIGTTATNTVANDGVNTIFFNAGLPAGVLGRATTSFAAAANGACNGVNTVWWADDIDVEFKTDPPIAGRTWEFGPALPVATEFDFESVAVHELGHALGLAHRVAPGAVMHYALSNGSAVRSPDAVEIAGATAKLAYSTAPSCFNPSGSGSAMTISGCTLPVTFISFDGKRKNKVTNELNWTVAHATNNTGYAIERSADGEVFSQLDFVPEKSSSADEELYTYSDSKAGINPWYYRLKQTDRDGQYSYSKVIFLKGEDNTTWHVIASPDGHSMNVYSNLPAGFTAKFQLVSSSGQLVATRLVTNAVTGINTSALVKGVYYYRIIDKNNSNIISGSVLLGH